MNSSSFCSTSNAFPALCHTFVMSGNPAFLLAEWPSSSACSFVVSGNTACGICCDWKSCILIG